MNCLDSKMKIQCYAIFLTLTCVISSALADPSQEKGTGSLSMSIDAQRVERSPKYDFGLGKRRYIITTGGPGKKRLPHYNFGLGKRSDANEILNYDDDTEFFSDTNNLDKAGINMENWENGGYMDNKNDINVIDDYELIEYPRSLGKRRVYDFGLGKRKFLGKRFESTNDKRLPNYPRFNFGLGKR